MFLNCSTCFERHTAHHQELKNCNCSLWFYIRLRLPATTNDVKPEAAITVFELLMMSGVSLETCWTIKKHWNDKFYYTVSSCWIFLYDWYEYFYRFSAKVNVIYVANLTVHLNVVLLVWPSIRGFLLFLTSFHLHILDFESYCCTWSCSMTHTHTLSMTPLD